jgi:hypothetical protein
MNKKLIIFIMISTILYAGFSESDTSVYVPDLKTDVEGSTLKASENDLPDFSTIITIDNKSNDIKIVMPSSSQSDKENLIENEKREMERTFAIEGLIGATYPLGFDGNFCIYTIYGQNPFKIDFKHTSMNGYANNNLSSGYNDRLTSALIEKEFNLNEAQIKIGASFYDQGNGLQNKSVNISDINKEIGNVFGNINLEFPNGFFLYTGVDGEVYDRFSTIMNYTSSVIVQNPWISNNVMISLSPNVYVGRKIDQFVFGVKADYDFEYNINNSISEIYELNTGNRLNRGEFTLISEWKNDFSKLFANVSLVIGDHIGQNSFIIPFTIGVNFDFPVYFSTKKMDFKVEGGVKSVHNLVSDLEKKYDFSAISIIPYETSNIYLKGNLFVPIINTMELKLDVDYEKTLYGNGEWYPDYDISNMKNGLYTYTMKEQHILKTDLRFSILYKLFLFNVDWKANWLDCPILEEYNTFLLETGLKSDNWGLTGSIEYSPAAYDSMPNIGVASFIKVNSKIQLNVSLDDLVKLFKGEKRSFQKYYAARGGSVNVSAKINF